MSFFPHNEGKDRDSDPSIEKIVVIRSRHAAYKLTLSSKEKTG